MFRKRRSGVSMRVDDPAAASQFIELNLLVSDEVATLRSLLPTMLSTYPALNDITNLGFPYYTTIEEEDAEDNHGVLKHKMKESVFILKQLQRTLDDLRSVTFPKTKSALRRHFLHIDCFLKKLLRNLNDLIYASNYSIAEEKCGQLQMLLNTTKYDI